MHKYLLVYHREQEFTFMLTSIFLSPMVLPAPTATTSPPCGFVCAVDGSKMPPTVFSSAALSFTSTLSPRGFSEVYCNMTPYQLNAASHKQTVGSDSGAFLEAQIHGSLSHNTFGVTTVAALTTRLRDERLDEQTLRVAGGEARLLFVKATAATPAPESCTDDILVCSRNDD